MDSIGSLSSAGRGRSIGPARRLRGRPACGGGCVPESVGPGIPHPDVAEVARFWRGLGFALLLAPVCWALPVGVIVLVLR